MARFLHEQNDFFYDYGVEFADPVANGLLHFDVIVRPRPSLSSSLPPLPPLPPPPSVTAAATAKPSDKTP
jgi:hypothetical protein